MSAQGVLVADHAVERAAGADTFLLCKFLIRHRILAVQFLPRAHHVDVVERLSYPVLMMFGKVESRLAAKCLQFGSIAPADAPHILDGTPFQSLLPFVVRINHAAMLICSIFLRQFRGNLGQCLVGSQSDADWKSHFALHSLMQVFSPLLPLNIDH